MLNDFTICGRFTKPIEKKTTPSGFSVMNNTVAVDRDRKNGDEKLTDFIDCVFWRHNADYLEKYASKGSMVVVHGRLESRKYEDKSGNKRTAWELQAENVYLVGGNRDSANNTSGNTFSELTGDDLESPF